MLRRSLRTALLALVPALVAAQQADVLPRPDPALQETIRRATNAASEAEQRTALEALRASAGPGHAALLAQLFLVSLTATDVREGMALGFVIHALAIPPADVVRALVPLLESGDPAVRAEVGGVLAEYEDRSVERGPDFSAYRPFLEVEGEPPPGLVRHLYSVDPGAGLLALARAQVRDPAELRGLLWAEHEIADTRWKLAHGYRTGADLPQSEPDALTELAALARHPRWWARLLAARVAADEPALRAAVPMDALARDAHPLVREAAGAAPR